MSDFPSLSLPFFCALFCFCFFVYLISKEGSFPGDFSNFQHIPVEQGHLS